MFDDSLLFFEMKYNILNLITYNGFIFADDFLRLKSHKETTWFIVYNNTAL